MPIDVDPFQGLGVEVVSQGRKLDLYDDPDADQIVVEEKGYRRILYVEVVPGATFTIRVVMTDSFDLSALRGHHVVYAKLYHDGQSYGTSHYWKRREVESKLNDGRECSLDFARIWEYCKASKEWVKGNPIFSPIAIEETHDVNMTPAQIRNLGSIKMVILRGKRKERSTPRADYVPKEESITAVSEKMIKGKAISNIIKLQNASTRERGSSRYEVHHLDGEAGKTLTFEIRYRSRQSLQSLGCIPRTPTPEPDLREQNRALRERLALLERNASTINVKAESSNSAAGIKREGEDAKNRDVERPRVLGRTMVDLTGEVVDLTED